MGISIDKLKRLFGNGGYAKIVAELEVIAGAGDGETVATTGRSTGKDGVLLSLLQVVPWWESQKVFDMCLGGKGGAKVVPWWKSVTIFRRHFGGENRVWVYGGSHHFALLCGGKEVLKVKDRVWS
jgi:hypothetical protein